MKWTKIVTCELIQSISEALGPITDSIGDQIKDAATTSNYHHSLRLSSSYSTVPTSVNDITENALRMQGVRGTAAICLGFFFCFYGKKIFRPFIGLMGFFSFGLLGLLTGSWYSFHYEFTDEPFWVMVFALLMGSFGAMLCIKVWKMAIASISMVSGYIGTQYLMTVLQPVLNSGIDFDEDFFLSFLNTPNVFDSITPYTNYISVVGIIAAYILSRYFEDSIILFGTSIIGAVSIVYGIDIFSEYGFKETLVKCIQGNVEWPSGDSERPYLMFMNFGCLALIVLGVVVQYLTASPKKKVVVSSA